MSVAGVHTGSSRAHFSHTAFSPTLVSCMPRPRKREGTDIQAKRGPLWPEPPMLGVRAPKGGAGLVAAECGRPRLLPGEMHASQTWQGLRVHKVARLPQTSHQDTNGKAGENSAAGEAGRRREGQRCPRG